MPQGSSPLIGKNQKFYKFTYFLLTLYNKNLINIGGDPSKSPQGSSDF